MLPHRRGVLALDCVSRKAWEGGAPIGHESQQTTSNEGKQTADPKSPSGLRIGNLDFWMKCHHGGWEIDSTAKCTMAMLVPPVKETQRSISSRQMHFL